MANCKPWSKKDEDLLRWELEQARAAIAKPPDAPYDREAALGEELAKARASSREWQVKWQDLQSALRSFVLRLKVLDIDQLAKEQGEDGSVPLRLAISELRALVAAYDGKQDPYDALRYAEQAATTVATWSSTRCSTTATPYYKMLP